MLTLSIGLLEQFCFSGAAFLPPRFGRVGPLGFPLVLLDLFGQPLTRSCIIRVVPRWVRRDRRQAQLNSLFVPLLGGLILTRLGTLRRCLLSYLFFDSGSTAIRRSLRSDLRVSLARCTLRPTCCCFRRRHAQFSHHLRRDAARCVRQVISPTNGIARR